MLTLALRSTLALTLLGINACRSTPPKEAIRSTPISLANTPLIIGHRGAPGHAPEHTERSYELAVQMGADYIEPDLVATRDGVLISRHENEISETTDVAKKFPSRKTTKIVDGETIKGWFTEDFSLAEIKTLKAKERLPFRDQKQNGVYSILTFEEILQLRQNLSKKYGRDIGLAPELKHSTYFRSIGLPLEETFVALIKKYNLNSDSSPLLVQSFEVSNLKELKSKIKTPLVQLIGDPEDTPEDLKKSGKKLLYRDMVTPVGLKEIAFYATWVSPAKNYIFPSNRLGLLQAPTSLVAEAHKVGLKVVPYTFRNEKIFLPKNDWLDPKGEYRRYFELGVDALFSDFPETAFAARAEYFR